MWTESTTFISFCRFDIGLKACNHKRRPGKVVDIIGVRFSLGFSVFLSCFYYLIYFSFSFLFLCFRSFFQTMICKKTFLINYLCSRLSNIALQLTTKSGRAASTVFMVFQIVRADRGRTTGFPVTLLSFFRTFLTLYVCEKYLHNVKQVGVLRRRYAYSHEEC